MCVCVNNVVVYFVIAPYGSEAPPHDVIPGVSKSTPPYLLGSWSSGVQCSVVSHQRCNLYTSALDNKVIGWKITFDAATILS